MAWRANATGAPRPAHSGSGALAWRCSRDTGETRAEVMIGEREIIFCLWRCEELNRALEEDLRRLGLDLSIRWQGPCIHEEG